MCYLQPFADSMDIFDLLNTGLIQYLRWLEFIDLIDNLLYRLDLAGFEHTCRQVCDRDAEIFADMGNAHQIIILCLFQTFS